MGTRIRDPKSLKSLDFHDLGPRSPIWGQVRIWGQTLAPDRAVRIWVPRTQTELSGASVAAADASSLALLELIAH